MERPWLLHDLLSANIFFPMAGPTYYRTGHSSTIDHIFVPTGVLPLISAMWADTRLMRKLQLISTASKNDRRPIRMVFGPIYATTAAGPRLKSIEIG